MQIIAGLGNPGEKYNNTRHNVGFMFLDYLIQKKGLNWENNKKFEAKITKDGDTLFIKPQTFMNNSGISLLKVMSFYNLIPKKLILLKQKNSCLEESLTVIHDEIDLTLGKTKNSINRGPAGHNGIKSIINNLETKDFKRIRIGINGNRHEKMPISNYVLAKFNKEEIEILYNNIFPKIEL